MINTLLNLWESTGFHTLFENPELLIKTLIMYVIVGVLVYLAVVKGFEPLLLLPIATGMLLANLPGANLFHMSWFIDGVPLFSKCSLADGMCFINGIPLFDKAELINGVWQIDGIKVFINSLSDISVYSETVEGVKEWFASVALSSGESIQNVVFSINGSIVNEFISTKLSDIVSYAVGNGGLIDILYLGVKLGIYPSLIFLGVGAMTDFSPLIADPKRLFMGATAQLGVFAAFFGAILLGFSATEAAAIGIIGGADGPTAILVTKTLAPHLLGAIAIAAYSYMALIPMIQPPIMRALTTKKERAIKMETLRPVSKLELIAFPIIVIVVVALFLPDAAPLIGFLMFGNLLTVSGVADRISKAAQNELMNIVTIFLGVSVGATADAASFLSWGTIKIIVLGLAAFCLSTIGGLLGGKLMCWLTHGKINPLIGSAGVSAVPMAARVAQKVGREENPDNYLLMHAMGPNVAGVIGSAVAAGVFLALFK